MPATDLAANEGLYREPTDETLLRIFMRDGGLRGSPGAGADGGWPILRLGSDRFAIPGTTITLEFGPALAGDYRSDELSTTYTLGLRDDALSIDVPGRASIALLPIQPDVFAGSPVGSIRFARDRAGTPTGFTVHAYAARGVRFERAR